VEKEEVLALKEKCREIRYLTMDAIGRLGAGHVGGSLSVVEALVVLYYKHLRVDPCRPKLEGRDRFVLSKAHAGPALYSILADREYFSKDLLQTLNQPDTTLPSHVNMLLTPGIDMTAGSLGQGLSCAVGIALGSRMKKDGARVYALIGDGECQEGQVWEAAMFAAHMKLENLIVFCDYNKLQIDGSIAEINSLEPLADKWTSFGWHVINVPDGHDVQQVDRAVVQGQSLPGKPTIIILNTVKGKGVSFAEALGTGSHNMPVSKEQWQLALQELKGPQNV
jgi:transketolase